MFDKLFEPIQIRGMELRNRVVMSAMGTHESAESEDGKSVTDKLIAYHVALSLIHISEPTRRS